MATESDYCSDLDVVQSQTEVVPLKKQKISTYKKTSEKKTAKKNEKK